VRHPALFYAYRQQFLSQMLQFFNRLGRFPNSALENRTLAVGVADLIIEWEVHRRERLVVAAVEVAASSQGAQKNSRGVSDYGRGGEGGGREAMEDDSSGASTATAAAVAATSAAAAAGSGEDDFTLPPAMVEMVMNFLVRISLFTADHKDPNISSLSPK